MQRTKRVMIIDSLNLFLRSYNASPALSSHGPPVGGVLGYLRSLQKCMREIKPDEVIVVWDGPGGSRRKRTIFKNYKEGRKPVKMNRGNSFLTEEQDEQNKFWQQARLLEYLNNLPVIQLLAPEVEADDLIALVAKNHKYSDWNKIIVSNDKDFIQLCDRKTILHRPTQAETLNYKSVLEKYGIHPNNFTIARAMEGDKSDNIAGVKGIGLKSVKKYLPILAEEKSYLLSEIKDYCEEKKEEKIKTKFYDSVLDNMDLILQNYKIMQLDTPNISPQATIDARTQIAEFHYEMNWTAVETMLIQDRIGDTNFAEMRAMFNKIVVENK